MTGNEPGRGEHRAEQQGGDENAKQTKPALERVASFGLRLPADLASARQNADNDTRQPAAKGDRLFGLGINEGSIGFGKAFAAARDAGLQFVELPSQWDDIEPKPGEFTNQWLDIANAYYPAVGIRLVISLNPIDTNKLRMPADLSGKPFDDPAVIERYNKAADYVLSRVSKANLVAFAIGNEIDGYLGGDPKKWQQYARFFEATSEHVGRTRPGSTVGAKVMLSALVRGAVRWRAGQRPRRRRAGNVLSAW